MANFIFDQGAVLMAGAGLDWVNTDYEIALYQNNVPSFDQTAVWGTFSGVLPTMATGVGGDAVLVLANRAVSSEGVCQADSVYFEDVTIVAPGSYALGFIIKRASDNLLIMHADEGVEGMIPYIQASPSGATFRITPNFEAMSGWFRP